MEIVSIDNADHYVWGDGADGWYLVRSSNLSVIEEMVPPGCSEIRHYHERSEQFFYVLIGKVVIEFNGTENELMPNQGLHIPAGIPHKLSNNTDKEAKFIVVSAPPSHGDRVKA